MYGMLGILTLSLVGLVGMGVYYELRPPRPKAGAVGRLRGTVAANLVLFVAAEAGLLLVAVDEAFAQPAAGGATTADVSLGMGLALIGAGIPTAVATIAAGIAVATVGSAAMAAISEKPEAFGRTLVYLGLAEGIAIYGLVVTILMLGKLP